MFTLDLPETYKWPVSVDFPIDGGKFKTVKFEAELKRLTKTQIDDATQKLDDGEVKDIDFAKEILVGWCGIKDADGNEVPYSESVKAQMLDRYHQISRAVVTTFVESQMGAKRKN